MVVVAGDKRGNLMAWTTTLFGCEGMSTFSAHTSVVNEIRKSMNVSPEHIRSLKHLRCSTTANGGSESESSHRDSFASDLIVVGDGQGRTMVVNILFSKATEEAPPELHFAIVQSSWVHASAVVAIKTTNGDDGFVTIEKDGCIGVWKLEGGSGVDAQEDTTQNHRNQRIHYQLLGLANVTGKGGRAVTCMELIEQRRGKTRRKGSSLRVESKVSSNNRESRESRESRGKKVLPTAASTIVAMIGTRGVFGTKSKAIRQMLKDHTILGYNATTFELLFQLPNHRTIYSILPIGLRYVLVASEVDENQRECLSLWDTKTATVIQTLNIGKRPQQYGRLNHLLPMVDSKTKMISHLICGMNSGTLLTLKVGFNSS